LALSAHYAESHDRPLSQLLSLIQHYRI
jgi:hypothetical protein